MWVGGAIAVGLTLLSGLVNFYTEPETIVHKGFEGDMIVEFMNRCNTPISAQRLLDVRVNR